MIDEKYSDIWPTLTTHAGESFTTTGRGRKPGKPFTYSIRGGEMFISTKTKSITRATVVMAYQRATEIQAVEGCVSGPKRIGTFGASYLYAVFVSMGIISRMPVDLLTLTEQQGINSITKYAKGAEHYAASEGFKEQEDYHYH